MRLLPPILLAAVWWAADASATVPSAGVAVNQWLISPPIAMPQPVFADTTSTDAARFLETVNPDPTRVQPRESTAVGWSPGRTLLWEKARGSELNWRIEEPGPWEVYAAAYVVSARWQRTALMLNGSRPLTCWFDGQAISQSSSMNGADWEVSTTLTLHRGKHLLLVKMAGQRGAVPEAWHLRASLDLDSTRASSVSFSTEPKRAPASFSDVTLFDDLSSPTLSPDGKHLAVIRSHRDRDLNKESWLEVWDAKAGRRERTVRPVKGIGNPVFFSDNRRLAFTASADKGKTVWVLDLVSGEMATAVRSIEGLQKMILSPDGKFLYYTADAEKEKSEEDYQLWNRLEDRMSDWTDSRQLFVVSLESGAVRSLTATGPFALDEFALSREGDRLLFTRRLPKVGRPYYDTEFWLYDLTTDHAERVLTQPIPFETRPLSLTWLPGGEKIAYVTAAFLTDPSDTTHNLSQTGLYLLDVKTGHTVNLSAGQVFSVEESEGRGVVRWNDRDKTLWFTAIDGGRVKVMKVDPLASLHFEEVPLGLPYVGDFDLSAGGICAYVASAPSRPVALYVCPGHSKTPIIDPAAEVLPDCELATVEKQDFVNSDGLTIEGWLFYPPDFDSTLSRSWPLIVYYYGGVSPRDEHFTFTYHWWTANGYVLYVLNPVGAVGYGQAFADRHSNDWGTLATRDIIEGTQKLLQEKPFLDRQRVGAYGGSYGGFITLDLVTKTDWLAAAISDAGISNIASYFGGGVWGFTYGDIALPGSFPWNRPDLFVGKSPVFHADRIRTPLLLIHGTADDNVPCLQSDQMFTALKVLGRDVAYVRFPGEDHSIATHYSNYVTYREMMLEWFDKYLKHQPEAWDARWSK